MDKDPVCFPGQGGQTVLHGVPADAPPGRGQHRDARVAALNEAASSLAAASNLVRRKDHHHPGHGRGFGKSGQGIASRAAGRHRENCFDAARGLGKRVPQPAASSTVHRDTGHPLV